MFMNLDNVYENIVCFPLCQMCEAFLTHGHGLSHGRRQVGIGNDAHVAQLCGGCCDTDACNRNGCYTISEYISCNIIKLVTQSLSTYSACNHNAHRRVCVYKRL